MASRGTPLYQQVGQYGHRIGKAPLYTRTKPIAIAALSVSRSGNLYGKNFTGRTDNYLELHKYDVFAVAASASDTQVTTRTILAVPPAATLAKNLPKRPEVGDYFEFSLVNNMAASMDASANNAFDVEFSTTGWNEVLGTPRKLRVGKVGNLNTLQDRTVTARRIRCIWTSVTPGSEALDYMIVG